jgi:hypothetical protein
LKIEPITPHDPGPPKLNLMLLLSSENTFKVPTNDVMKLIEEPRFRSFKTDSNTAKIRYRDGAYVDGDGIEFIYKNYKVVDYEVLLEGDFKV